VIPTASFAFTLDMLVIRKVGFVDCSRKKQSVAQTATAVSMIGGVAAKCDENIVCAAGQTPPEIVL
jgi:hypothetical protein